MRLAPPLEARERTIVRLFPYALVALPLLGLALGAALWWSASGALAETTWTVATLPVLITLLIQIVVSLRRGDVGLDVVAALSMSAALVFGEPLAGNVVALMYAGGQLLESFAQGRARHEMTALLGRVAHTAMRYQGSGLEEVPIAAIVAGDRILIRQGEVLPVDGRVAGTFALLDLSTLTGESVPQRVGAGGEALSGSTSAGPAFELIATRAAAESTYAGIVRLVEAAQNSKAPMVRIADRYAIGFLALTVVIAALAWIISQDPLRALAVLVVATPCPLILAVPVAVISGMSRAARAGVLIKSGGVLEALAGIQTAILDKTGTLTHGRAVVSDIRSSKDFSEADVLRLAASLDQASGHVVAAALIEAATGRGLVLSSPTNVNETPGLGIEGQVEGRQIVVGGDSFVHRRIGDDDIQALHAGLGLDATTVAVAVDGMLAGVIVLEDRVRDDAGAMLASLRHAGIRRIVLASGDKQEIALAVGNALGVDLTRGELSPEQKVAVVRSEAASGPVMMVGDGVNDAPALAAADVGVAMGARGTASSSEAAGVVLLVDQLEPLAKAITIARRTRAIALQSVLAGLGLSMAAMLAAALGYLPPVQGALLQEAIDVAVILNALRALR
ncbi:heavy metal translocating P-type ATPase [Devosia sp. SL43]|uniref:heavy metal translocating P-type ATPase n=1 Tax=Devosia sp. SL43 TaxID=2806348 RepID=UPI001F02A1B4|nr:heavy metal translocating P-type ATPase [Devosia sp. SL43]UJW85663.1 heavy metal translocating P-type ATPase [Devosia sp. SL43]